LHEQVRKYEVAIILKAMEESGGDRRAAAQKLNIGLSSLYRKLEEFDSAKLQPDSQRNQIETRVD
jgi:two-component system response regulator AtoC